MSVSSKLRWEILQRDGFRCAYCGVTASAGELEVDHIHPRAAGGSDHRENLTTACVACNQGKSSALPDQYVWECARPTRASDALFNTVGSMELMVYTLRAGLSGEVDLVKAARAALEQFEGVVWMLDDMAGVNPSLEFPEVRERAVRRHLEELR